MRIFYSHFSLLICLLLANLSWAEDKFSTDLQVLVDVSGSMKKTDPNNLRAPAIRLLANLLEPSTRVGIWLFDELPSALLSTQAATNIWKKRLIKASNNIHTHGQYTNIQAAIAVALEELKPLSNKQKHIIILSDGNVDVSKRTQVNELSRSIIVKTFLPLLKQQGIKVHTIALSEYADHELLKIISQETGGWYEKADNTDKLNQIFLRLYERSVEKPSLPISNNKFIVDPSVDDMTVIVFRKLESNAELNLKSPDGKTLSKLKLLDDMRWHQDKTFDLITVTKPVHGEWQILGDIDPSNRVLVVTNLSLHLETVPTYVLPGEIIPLRVNLKHNKTSHDLLDKTVEFSYSLSHKDKLVTTDKLSLLTNTNGDSIKQYTGQFQIPQQAGTLQLKVQAQSPTFARDKKIDLQVLDLPIKYTTGQTSIEFIPQSNDAVSLESAKLSFADNVTDVALDKTSQIEIPESRLDPVLALKGKIRNRDFEIEHKIVLANIVTEKPSTAEKPKVVKKDTKVSVVFANVLIFNGILGIIILLSFMFYQKRLEKKSDKESKKESKSD